MKKLKEYEKYLDSIRHENGHYRDDSGQYLCVLSCVFGDNFYDYGEEPPRNFKYDNELLREIGEDRRVRIVDCADCCGCAGW